MSLKQRNKELEKENRKLSENNVKIQQQYYQLREEYNNLIYSITNTAKEHEERLIFSEIFYDHIPIKIEGDLAEQSQSLLDNNHIIFISHNWKEIIYRSTHCRSNNISPVWNCYRRFNRYKEDKVERRLDARRLTEYIQKQMANMKGWTSFSIAVYKNERDLLKNLKEALTSEQ